MTALALPVTEPRARFLDLVSAEWWKLWSLRSTGWSLLIAALSVTGFNAGQAWDHYRYWNAYDEGSRVAFVRDGMALWDAFNGNAVLVMMLAAAGIGAMAIAGEYSSGSIRTTFAAVPARRSVMTAKVLVTALVLAGFGTVVAAVSFWATQAILSVHGAGLPITHPGALRIVVASALLAPVSGLVGMALGTVLRSGPAAIVASVVVLLLLPAVTSERRYWSAVLAHVQLQPAWERLIQTGDWPAPFPWTTGGAWLVYGAWALGAALVTVLAVRRRDQ
ncbi:ABC transporter permease subunit [Streptomyces sp. NPDC101115]|uniref:ABC transporter permease subunit n=1 Tax=Streptomyces sp. NPDC101115 TaxID=3366106 RepID=UPI0037FCF0AA